MSDSKRAGEKDIRKIFNLVKGAVSKLDKSKLSVSGGVITSNKAVPLEISVTQGDETAIRFRNKGISLGNINFNANRFQIFSDNLPGIVGKQILIISNVARNIFDYKSGALKEILVQGDQITSAQVTVKNGEKSLIIKPGADQIDFVNASGKWRIQSHYSENLERQAFALYDIDADYDGGGRVQEMFHLSQKTRTIYNHKRSKTAEIVVDDDLKFWPGDVWSLGSDIPFAGYLTTGSTQIYFTIPLHRKCQDRTITLSGKLTVRGTEGYLLNLEDVSTLKIITNGYENLLRVIVEKTDKSKFSELNNIPVAVSLNNNPQITFS